MTYTLINSTVKKIAFVNPYLQGGHNETAEMESIARFIQTANARGIEVRVFASSAEVEKFDPDFIIGITYQEAKLTPYPSYLNFNIPISMIKDTPRFVRNILTYDGFFTPSPSIVNFINEICAAHNKKKFIANGYFSLPKTEFKPADFSKAVAMYMGTNWDGIRHNNIFKLLSNGEYLKCYGPAKSWMNYPASLYGGEIPFDGKSALQRYHQHAAGLCLGHPIFDSEGVANNRIYETVAASALAICANNELNQSFYGDSVLYVDHQVPTPQLAAHIIDHVKWMRSHAGQAQEMAKAAHEIFCNTISMEFYLNEILAMHERVLKENHYLTSPKPDNLPVVTTLPQVTYLLTINEFDQAAPLLVDLQKQTYSNINVIALVKSSSDVNHHELMHKSNQNLKITYLDYKDPTTNKVLFEMLGQTEWLGVLNTKDRLFANHTAVLMDAFNRNNAENLIGVASGSLECSDELYLPEHLIDEHYIYNNNKTRVGNLEFNTSAPLCSVLLRYPLLNLTFLEALDFSQIASVSFFNEIQKQGTIFSSCEITSASYVNFAHDQLAYLNEMIRKYDDTKKHLYNADRGVVALNQRVNELQMKIDEQQQHINALMNSRVWVYTAPLRRLLNKLRSLKRQFGLSN